MADLVGQRVSPPSKFRSLTSITLAITEGMVVVDVVLTTSILDGVVELLYITWDTVSHMDGASSSKRNDYIKGKDSGEFHDGIEGSTVEAYSFGATLV
jgi:hypothetical protein